MPIFDSQYPVNSNPAGEDKILTTDTSDASAVKGVTLTKVQEWLGSISKWVVTSMIADGAVDTLQIADGAVTPDKRSGGFIVSDVDVSTTGTKTVNVGYQPTLLRIYGTIANNEVYASSSVGSYDGANIRCLATAVRGGQSASSSRLYTNAFQLNITGTGGTSALCRIEDFTITPTGYTCNVVTSSGTSSVWVEAYR